MPEPFKNLFNKPVIENMSEHFSKVLPGFDKTGFVAMAAHDLDALELKQRSTQITDALVAFLPDNFEQAAAVMLASLAPDDGYAIDMTKSDQGIIGWAIMPMVDYVGLHGLGHFELAMNLFKELTKRSSSEFGIRYFLMAEQTQTLAILHSWTDDTNYHVRRLISEGTRPRLPWGMQLTAFVKDPAPVIELLEKLKDDEHKYVRRSVANNLNDIAKDHPDLVADIARDWLRNADVNRSRMVKHACRTLVKKGHKGALKALGYEAPLIALEKIQVLTPEVNFGEALIFELVINSTAKQKQNLIIDYAIHHVKANGKTSAKVFKWKNLQLAALATLTSTRKHAIRKITTRTYYPGVHCLEIIVNGESLCTREFGLIM